MTTIRCHLYSDSFHFGDIMRQATYVQINAHKNNISLDVLLFQSDTLHTKKKILQYTLINQSFVFCSSSSSMNMNTLFGCRLPFHNHQSSIYHPSVNIRWWGMTYSSNPDIFKHHSENYFVIQSNRRLLWFWIYKPIFYLLLRENEFWANVMEVTLWVFFVKIQMGSKLFRNSVYKACDKQRNNK